MGGGQAKQIRDELDLESGAARPEELSRDVSEKKTDGTELELEMIRNSQILCLPCPCPCPTTPLPCPTFKISSTSLANYCSLACVSTHSMGPIFRLCCSNAKGAVYHPMLDSPACMEPYCVPGPGEGWGVEELEVQSQVKCCLHLPDSLLG